jgi:hypothetical protein
MSPVNYFERCLDSILQWWVASWRATHLDAHPTLIRVAKGVRYMWVLIQIQYFQTHFGPRTQISMLKMPCSSKHVETSLFSVFHFNLLKVGFLLLGARRIIKKIFWICLKAPCSKFLDTDPQVKFMESDPPPCFWFCGSEIFFWGRSVSRSYFLVGFESVSRIYIIFFLIFLT